MSVTLYLGVALVAAAVVLFIIQPVAKGIHASLEREDDEIVHPPTIPEVSENNTPPSTPPRSSPQPSPSPSPRPPTTATGTQSRMRPKSPEQGSVRAAGGQASGMRLDLELSEPNLVTVVGGKPEDVASLTNSVSEIP